MSAHMSALSVAVRGSLTFEDFVVVMSSMEENSTISEEDEEKELQNAFRVCTEFR